MKNIKLFRRNNKFKSNMKYMEREFYYKMPYTDVDLLNTAISSKN